MGEAKRKKALGFEGMLLSALDRDDKAALRKLVGARWQSISEIEIEIDKEMFNLFQAAVLRGASDCTGELAGMMISSKKFSELAFDLDVFVGAAELGTNPDSDILLEHARDLFFGIAMLKAPEDITEEDAAELDKILCSSRSSIEWLSAKERAAGAELEKNLENLLGAKPAAKDLIF